MHPKTRVVPNLPSDMWSVVLFCTAVFFSCIRRHTRFDCDWSSDVCSSDLLVAVAAVIGREFDFPLLQRAADLGEAEAAEGAEELVRRRVLHGVGECFDFTHDRIREVAYAGLLAPRCRLLHRRVAEAIEAVYAGNL